MEEDRSLKDEVRELRMAMQTKGRKTKPFKIPFRARLSKGALNRGYVTVAIIEDNKAVNFKKEPIIDGTIKLLFKQ